MLKAPEDKIKNVIAHELLHTCYGCYNHGKRWKFYAQKMNQAYGYNITTTASYEKLDLPKPEISRTYNTEVN